MNDRMRVLVSVALTVAAVAASLVLGTASEEAGTEQATGTVIDYGGHDTRFVELDMSIFDSMSEVIGYVAVKEGLELSLDGDGGIAELDGIGSGPDGRWDLWVVYPGSNEWVRMDVPYDQDPDDFTITSWSFTGDGELPTIAVDFTGNPIYGFQQKHRVVSLSPTITEILGSVKAKNIIFGVDSYSDHPQSVVDGREDGSIKTVGTYTNPSFELVTSVNPDIVFCDGMQRTHIQMAAQLRNAGIDAMVIYPGEDIDCIMDNIFAVGTVIGYGMAADEVLQDTEDVLRELSDRCHSPHPGGIPDVMVSLEPDMSPWVSGSGTYMHGLLEEMNARNVFSDWFGWVHLTSDRIPHADPDKIIVVTTEYSATQEEYDHLYGNLSPQWKATDAWRNGEVYVICEGAAEIMQRFGPRTAESAEIVAKILYPEKFGIELPKIVGDDYMNYLEISAGMDYN